MLKYLFEFSNFHALQISLYINKLNCNTRTSLMEILIIIDPSVARAFFFFLHHHYYYYYYYVYYFILCTNFVPTFLYLYKRFNLKTNKFIFIYLHITFSSLN